MTSVGTQGGNGIGVDKPEMVIRYEAPADDISDALTGYHLYARPAPGAPQVDWFLPGMANIRITVDAGPVSVRIARRSTELSPISLFGPTTRAMRAITHHGVMIGFGLSPVGWARMFSMSASDVRDRIVPLGPILGEDVQRDLLHAFEGAGGAVPFKERLDVLLRPLVAEPHADEPLIHRINDLVLDNDHVSVTRAADDLGITEHTLRRLSTRYFGMPPKMLLSRARFLRVFIDLLAHGLEDYDRISPSYHDVPHFLRDARRFLGMTPRQFHLLKTPFLDASLAIRPRVLGAPTQALHRI